MVVSLPWYDVATEDEARELLVLDIVIENCRVAAKAAADRKEFLGRRLRERLGYQKDPVAKREERRRQREALSQKVGAAIRSLPHYEKEPS